MMQPPYVITPKVLKLIASISEKIGEVNAVHLNKPPTELRKKNRIKTIQSSLEIEGNTLTEEQITAVLNNKRIIAPEKDIVEVRNAINVYNQIHKFDPHSIKDFCHAHKLLMTGLLNDAGQFRRQGVGIVKGTVVTHLASHGHMVHTLMKDLFSYLSKSDELAIIKSCVFHYEVEFIHPFVDGNGRMGRLWQTVLLMAEHPLFEFLPVEALIKERQLDYYNALSLSDKSGQATHFMEFMLEIIELSLEQLLKNQKVTLTNLERINLFKDKVGVQSFSRKDYMRHFKEISTATASRDLKLAVDKGLLLRKGDKRLTIYHFK